MSHLRFEMSAGIDPFLPSKKPKPSTPKPSSAPAAKPIPKPVPKGDNSDD